jgi:peptidoglycan/LPS O-acetylase OafA/YrhL
LGLILVRVADRDFYYWSRNMATYGYTLVAVLFGAVLLLCLRQQRDTIITRLLSSRFLTKSGKYSYALYLVHVPIAALFYPAITRLAVRTVTGLGYQMIFVVYFVASFAVSWLIAAVSWHVFEKRILALKRYFIYRPRGAEQLSAVTQN